MLLNKPGQPDSLAQSCPDDALAARFRILADQWKAETGMFSLHEQKAQHPAYREIIAMGDQAIPLILRELQERPYRWFAALRELTGENPIPLESAGQFEPGVAAWLKWGREKEYIPGQYDAGTVYML